MAVFQISKIQVRRGLRDSLPQLSAGEMGWAIDTQELFIGNGSVSEGAPAVGFTKLITSQDLSTNLIQTLQYAYDAGAEQGSLQGKLSETVSSSDFGTKGNGITDDTVSLQNAIDTLFKNQTHPSTGTGGDNVKSRVTLEIPPGIYKLSNTLMIPSYATIVGAGIDKTIFNYTGSQAAFITLDTDITTLTHNILVSGLTIITENNVASSLFEIFSSNSEFSNLKLVGARTTTSLAIESKGMRLLEDSSNLIFENINISNVCFAVDLRTSVTNIKFNNGVISSVGYGFFLGSLTNLANENAITNFKFVDVVGHAVNITKGSDNYVNNCTMINVGNDQDGIQARYPQVYFTTYGNVCSNLKSDRLLTTLVTKKYVPEVAGSGEYTSGSYSLELPNTVMWNTVTRLPFNISSLGTTTLPISYKISYSYKCDHYIRSGIIHIATDPNKPVSISDEFTTSGDTDKSLLLDFSAEVDFASLTIKARNTEITSSLRQLTYTYTAIF